MFQSTYIGRPFGIRLSLHGTFWLLPALVLVTSFLGSGLPAAVLDVAVLLALFGCVAMHELGHALAARQFGIRTRSIVLYPIGGVASLERIPREPMKEIVIALAGPAVNVAIAAGIGGLMWLDGVSAGAVHGYGSAVEIFWSRLFVANVGLAIFNMIPAFPMDGGRVLRATLACLTTRSRATAIAANVGTVFAVGFFLVGLFGGFNPMLMLLALFLFTAGRSELADVRAEESGANYRRRSFAEEMPIGRPTRSVDGWVYDPQGRAWTKWEHGVPVQFVRV